MAFAVRRMAVVVLAALTMLVGISPATAEAIVTVDGRPATQQLFVERYNRAPLSPPSGRARRILAGLGLG